MASQNDLTYSEQETILTIQYGATGLSLIGELFMITSYFCSSRESRSLSLKMIMGLISSDMLYSFANIMSIMRRNPIVCFWEGYLRQYSIVSSFLWIWTISYVSYRQARDFDDTLTGKYKTMFLLNHLCSFIFAAITPILGFLGVNTWYGLEEKVYCALYPNDMEVYFGYLPIFIFTLLTLLNVLKLICILRNKSKKLRIHSQSMMVYPFALLVCWTPGLIDKLYVVITGEISFIILCLHISLTRLTGFINLIIYGRNRLSLLSEAVFGSCSGSNRDDVPGRTKSRAALSGQQSISFQQWNANSSRDKSTMLLAGTPKDAFL